MKKLTYILTLLALTATLSAQYYGESLKQVRKNQWLRLGLYTTSVILDATGDAQYDIGNKELGKLLQAGSVASLIAIPCFTKMDKKDWHYMLSMAVTLRYSMFDYGYNASRGLPLDYKGNTSYYDNFLSKQPEQIVNFSKIVSGVVGVSLNFTF